MSSQPSSWLKLLFFIFVLIVQVVLNNMVVLGPFIYISFIPLLVMILPLKQSAAISIILAFLMGLIIDLASLDTIGINAGAATLICFLRKPVFSLCFNITDKQYTLSIAETGLLKHLLCLLYLSLIYFAFYTGFDGFAANGFFLTILRILASCLVSISLSIILDFTILNSK